MGLKTSSPAAGKGALTGDNDRVRGGGGKKILGFFVFWNFIEGNTHSLSL